MSMNRYDRSLTPPRRSLPEQQAMHSYQARGAASVGIPLADDEDNDRIYETRRPSSVRRYRSSTTADVLVTQRPLALVVHDQRRRSRTSRSVPAPHHQQVPLPPPSSSRRPRLFLSHPLLFFGVGMVSMLLLWVGGNVIVGWWHTQQSVSIERSGPQKVLPTDIHAIHFVLVQ